MSGPNAGKLRFIPAGGRGAAANTSSQAAPAAKYKAPDLAKEYAKIYEPTGPQSAKLKPGATGEQAKEYWRKANIVKAAESFYYQGGKSAKAEVESLLNDGFTKIKAIVAGIRLYNAKGGYVTLKNKAAIDYARLLMEG